MEENVSVWRVLSSENCGTFPVATIVPVFVGMISVVEIVVGVEVVPEETNLVGEFE